MPIADPHLRGPARRRSSNAPPRSGSSSYRTSLTLRACSSRHARDIADHLWVDLPMLEARMNALDPIEIAELEHHLEDQWLWIP
jgi:hypothetical protein